MYERYLLVCCLSFYFFFCLGFTSHQHSTHLTCPVAVVVGVLKMTCQPVLSIPSIPPCTAHILPPHPSASILSFLWCCLSISSSVFLSFYLLWLFPGALSWHASLLLLRDRTILACANTRKVYLASFQLY